MESIILSVQTFTQVLRSRRKKEFKDEGASQIETTTVVCAVHFSFAAHTRTAIAYKGFS